MFTIILRTEKKFKQALERLQVSICGSYVYVAVKNLHPHNLL